MCAKNAVAGELGKAAEVKKAEMGDALSVKRAGALKESQPITKSPPSAPAAQPALVNPNRGGNYGEMD
jgi:hypothetical protein